jgi:hypothetical protein
MVQHDSNANPNARSSDYSDSEEVLGARLDSALRANLGSNGVNVAALLDGSRSRARRVRAQRIAAMAAAGALVVAVPVSYELIRPEPNSVVQPAAMLPSSSRPAAVLPTSHPAVTQTRSPTPTVPRPSRPFLAKSKPTRTTEASSKPAEFTVYAIPDSLAFTADELPAGLTVNYDGAGANVPTVLGQSCDPSNPKAAKPITGRQWTWVDDSGKMTATTVDLTVTGWHSGTGKRAFDELVSDTGYCHWSDPQTKVDFHPATCDQSWAGTSTFASLHHGKAVVRLGDVIAGIQVQEASGIQEAAKVANALATKMCDHLRGSGLAAVKQQ